MKLYSNYNRFKSPIQMKMCHVIASIGIKMPKMITLFTTPNQKKLGQYGKRK